MFDFEDLFLTTADAGSYGRKWWPILGAVIGGCLGLYLGYMTGGVWSALAGVPIGALLGFVAALLLRGAFLFLILFVIALAAAGLWAWVQGMIG